MKRYWGGLLSLWVAACTTFPTPETRQIKADALADTRGWHGETINAGAFLLKSYTPAAAKPVDTLFVYIEGDGFAWTSPSQPSSNPTPNSPLALQLALAQPKGVAAYLGRPCQFVGSGQANCQTPEYWTNKRFAQEVIDSSNSAIDQLKRRFEAKQLVLIGYSGGGAVAALVASQRNDVLRLITVAGNLEHRQWTVQNRLQALDGSLDAADRWADLLHTRQTHFAGGEDRVISSTLTQSFARRFPRGQRPQVIVKPTYDHRCCWVENWPELWNQAMEDQ